MIPYFIFCTESLKQCSTLSLSSVDGNNVMPLSCMQTYTVTIAAAAQPKLI